MEDEANIRNKIRFPKFKSSLVCICVGVYSFLLAEGVKLAKIHHILCASSLEHCPCSISSSLPNSP